MFAYSEWVQVPSWHQTSSPPPLSLEWSCYLCACSIGMQEACEHNSIADIYILPGEIEHTSVRIGQVSVSDLMPAVYILTGEVEQATGRVGQVSGLPRTVSV